MPKQTCDPVITGCVLVTSDTVSSESLECGINDGVSAVMNAACVDAGVDTGVVNELHHPATGIDSRVNDGVAKESHHPATGINTGATDAVRDGAAAVPDHTTTGVKKRESVFCAF